MNENEKIMLDRELEKCKTNHILHLLLSVITWGLWAIVWLHIAQKNAKKRSELLGVDDESFDWLGAAYPSLARKKTKPKLKKGE